MRVGNISFTQVAVLVFLSSLYTIVASFTPYASRAHGWGIDSSITQDSSIPTNVINPECDTTNIQAIEINDTHLSEVNDYNACVRKAKNYAIAYYSDKANYHRWAVKLPSDLYYVPIENVDYSSKLTVGLLSDRLSFLSFTSGSVNATLSSFKNGTDAFTVSEYSDSAKPLKYRLKVEESKKWFAHIEDGRSVYSQVNSHAMSMNGEYVLAWVDYTGYARVNLNTGVITGLGRFPGASYGGASGNPYAAAITNDGRYAFISDGPTLIDLNACGYEITQDLQDSGNAFSNSQPQCPKLSYAANIASLTGFNGYGNHFKWVGAEDGLVFLYETYPYQPNFKQVMVTISKNTLSNSKIDYLALGDSYSSGEGDTGRLANGASFYTPATSGAGGCHVSTRSYPFLLAQFSLLHQDKMKSVACSNARIAKDYYGSSSNYDGQWGQLKTETTEQKEVKRTSALNDFNPGIIKQVDFVRANKPKVVTLTGGGNDVGFGKLLTYCALPSGIGARSNTCDQAVANTMQRSILGDSIRSQHEKIIALISAIREASDTTTIYVIGYPSFVSEDNTTCLNSISLNKAERATINEGVKYLNTVLTDASKAAGAKYVDIETSLNGGRICEGSEYITGPLNVLGFDILDRKSETFHPNSDGHMKMAEAIRGKGFETKANANPAPQVTVAPAKPSTFGTSKYVPTFQDKLVSDSVIHVGKKLQLSLSPGYFAYKKAVTFTIWSKPENLGTYKTTAEGSLYSTTSLSKGIQPGYHMIVAEGESLTGGPLRLYQYVEVQSNKANDRDDDGIKDIKDKCQYIEHWYDEASKKDICASKKADQPASGHGGHNSNHGQHNGHTHGHHAHHYHWPRFFAHHFGLVSILFCIGAFGLRIR